MNRFIKCEDDLSKTIRTILNKCGWSFDDKSFLLLKLCLHRSQIIWEDIVDNIELEKILIDLIREIYGEKGLVYYYLNKFPPFYWLQ